MFPAIKAFFAIIVIIFFAIELIGCVDNTSEDGQGDNMISSKPLTEVLKEHTDELMSIPAVVGVAQGICDKKPCIEVYVTEMTSELVKEIPKNLNGYPVRVEETGVIKALPIKKK